MKLDMHPLQTSKKSIAIAACNFLQMIQLEMCWMVAKRIFHSFQVWFVSVAHQSLLFSVTRKVA